MSNRGTGIFSRTILQNMRRIGLSNRAQAGWQPRTGTEILRGILGVFGTYKRRVSVRGSCLIFWILNGYFLSQERLFRDLYDHVRKLEESKIDFSMDTDPFKNIKNRWARSIFSKTLLIFYLSLVGVMLIIIYFIY